MNKERNDNSKFQSLFVGTIIVSLLLSGMNVFSGNVKADTDTQVVNFGKEGHLGAEYYFTELGMNVGAEFDFGGGISWPIEVKVTKPNSIKPGQYIDLSIDTSGMWGEIWYQFYGHAEATVAGYTLYQKTINFPRTSIISMTVPIGQDLITPASSGQITVANWQENVDLYFTQYNISADLRFAFDFEITSSSYVQGNIQCSGKALDSDYSESYIWGPNFYESLQISNSAKTGDSLDITVSNMEYVLTNVNIRVKTFYVYAGYYTNLPLIGSEPNAIVGQIPISELIPVTSTRADNRNYGELIDISESVSINSVQTTLTIPPGYESSELGVDPIMIAVVLGGIAVAIVVGVGVLAIPKKQIQAPPQYNQYPPPTASSQLPNQNYNCAYCGKPLTYVQQNGQWFCHSCNKYN